MSLRTAVLHAHAYLAKRRPLFTRIVLQILFRISQLNDKKGNPKNPDLDFLIAIHPEDEFLGGEIRFQISRSIGKSGFRFWKSKFRFPNRTHPRSEATYNFAYDSDSDSAASENQPLSGASGFSLVWNILTSLLCSKVSWQSIGGLDSQFLILAWIESWEHGKQWLFMWSTAFSSENLHVMQNVSKINMEWWLLLLRSTIVCLSFINSFSPRWCT